MDKKCIFETVNPLKLISMKKMLFLLILAGLALQAAAQDFTPDEEDRIRQAYEYADSGQEDEAIAIYDELLKVYPKSSFLLYEKAYSLYAKREYAKAYNTLKPALKAADAFDRMFALAGNSLDNQGKGKQALKVYEDGLKRFPESGALYLERGTLLVNAGEVTDGVMSFLEGIRVEPGFPSNYYRAAQILCDSNEPVMGLICAEMHNLLDPESPRSKELSKALYDTYNANVRLDEGDTLRTTFTTKREIGFSPETMQLDIPFEILFETYTLKAIDPAALKEAGHLSIAEISGIRKRFLEDFFGDGQHREYLYPVYEFQQRVLAAGHWDAYNMWLMREGDREELDEWLATNEPASEAFLEWINSE